MNKTSVPGIVSVQLNLGSGRAHLLVVGFVTKPWIETTWEDMANKVIANNYWVQLVQKTKHCFPGKTEKKQRSWPQNHMGLLVDYPNSPKYHEQTCKRNKN